jgi:hypothetical protein
MITAQYGRASGAMTLGSLNVNKFIGVLDLFDSGEISSNLVEISDDLAELFGRYSERILPFIRPGNLEGRGIVGPDRKPLWPDTESLRWQSENVLRTR